MSTEPAAVTPATPDALECARCGVAVIDPKAHMRWHELLGEPVSPFEIRRRLAGVADAQ